MRAAGDDVTAVRKIGVACCAALFFVGAEGEGKEDGGRGGRGVRARVGRGLPTETTLTRPAGLDGFCGFRFTSEYLDFFRFLTAKSFLMEAPALPKEGRTPQWRWVGGSFGAARMFTASLAVAKPPPSRRGACRPRSRAKRPGGPRCVAEAVASLPVRWGGRGTDAPRGGCGRFAPCPPGVGDGGHRFASGALCEGSSSGGNVIKLSDEVIQTPASL